MKKYQNGVLVELSESEVEKIKNQNIEENIEETTDEKIAKLQEENELLKQCIIELSEVVYA